MTEQLLRLVELGGPVVSILLAISVLGLAVALFKLLDLLRFRPRQLRRLDEALDLVEAGESERGLQLAGGLLTPAAPAVTQALTWLAQGGVDEEMVKQELTRQGTRALVRLEFLLRPLEFIAYVAPLLGLLGTVLGMIDVFHNLEAQGADPDTGTLAGGIWEALLTTAVGLSIAIPFAAFHAAFDNAIEGIRRRMEDQFTRLLTLPLKRG